MFIAKPLPNPVVVTRPEGNDIPLLLDSPHSGTFYPADYNSHQPFNVVRRGEDTYVDDLYRSAVKYGATFVEALFPRTYIDPNRNTADVNPELIDGQWTEPVQLSSQGKVGKGLVWTAVKGANTEKLYNRKLTVAEVQHRIDYYHTPYHTTLRAEWQRLLDKFGMVYHINCHSMSHLADVQRDGEDLHSVRPAVCVIDADGATCSPEWSQTVLDIYTHNAKADQEVCLNFPYKVKSVLTEMCGKPEMNTHSVLVEISRALILDPATMEPFDHYGETKQQIENIVRDLAEYVRQQM